MTRRFRSWLLGALLPLAALAAPSHDPAAGRDQFASTCAMCHGDDAIAQMPTVPNLRGQKQPYLIQQLDALRAGTRRNATMDPIARCLTDQEIENLAAYRSSLNPAVPNDDHRRGVSGLVPGLMHGGMMGSGRMMGSGGMGMMAPRCTERPAGR